MPQYNDIGIDLGTSNILIFMRGKGVVLKEPSIVTIDRDSRKTLAIGNDALRMLGRTPSNILAVQPLRQGIISDFELTSIMLRYFVQKTIGKRYFSRPRAIISVPSGVNEIERRSLVSIMYDIGMRKTQLLEKPLAAAIGAKLPIEQAYGTMIVDIGAGVTDIAVISGGRIIVSGMSKIGGHSFTDAITRYLRLRHNIAIGERSAEEIKLTIGSAIARADELHMDITGRNILSGIPKTMKISSTEICESLDDPLQVLSDNIRTALVDTPAELASDIFDRGITLSGGGAELYGIEHALKKSLNIDCTVANEAQTCVVRGCGEVLLNPKEYNRYVANSQKRYHGI